MATQRLFETTLLGEDGWRGGVISASAPLFSEPRYPPVEVVMQLASELGFEVQWPKVAAHELQFGFLRTASDWTPERMDLAGQLIYGPSVIIELSPPRGESIATITTWSGGTASLVWAGASPGLIVAWHAVVAVAWMLLPGAEEVREHVREVVASWRRRHPPD